MSAHRIVPAGAVKANAEDIRGAFSARFSKLKSVVADANILYLIYYPGFEDLAAAGGKIPASYQTLYYPRWWKQAVEKKVKFYASSTSLAEFAHVMERTELEILWRTDPNRQELDPENPGQDFSAKHAKTVRFAYLGRLPAIRESVRTTLQAIRKNTIVMPQDPQPPTRALAEWIASAGDFGDAELVAAAKFVNGTPFVLSDDADLLTFDGITLLTANRNAIDAANAAGKLIS